MPSPNSYNGGYSAVTVQKMAKVELPTKICCAACKKWKVAGAYSKKQQSDLRYKIVQFGNPPSSTGLIKCRACTGQQVTELTCTRCDEVKGLDEFAYAQRRNPDGARCRVCVDELLAHEPGNEDVESDKESEPSNPYYSDGETNDSTDGGAPLDGVRSGLNSLQLEEHERLTGNSENFKASAGRVASWKLTEDDPSEDWTSFASTRSDVGDGEVYTGQAGKQIGTAYTAYDSHGVAHSRVRAPSTIATTERSFTPTRTYTSATTRFAKPTKLPMKAVPKVEPERQGYNVSTYEDSDSEDEDCLGEPINK